MSLESILKTQRSPILSKAEFRTPERVGVIYSRTVTFSKLKQATLKFLKSKVGLCKTQKSLRHWRQLKSQNLSIDKRIDLSDELEPRRHISPFLHVCAEVIACISRSLVSTEINYLCKMPFTHELSTYLFWKNCK